ncbi:MAG: hypothetical protein KAR80_00920 [Rhodospirillaceae bacterium]|nr:hypothetical protein [Rhodospirillaceae bacterium]
MNKAPTSLAIFAAIGFIGLIVASSSHAMATGGERSVTQAQELAVVAPMFLQLEITSSCTEKGSVFRIINRGKKWPRHGVLRLYNTDDKSVMADRKLRLAPNQKVSFVISKEKSKGRPIGMWIEPEWYEREFDYDAKSAC